MSEKELIDFLKEKLEIRISLDSDKDVQVVLVLCDEEISKDWVRIGDIFD